LSIPVLIKLGIEVKNPASASSGVRAAPAAIPAAGFANLLKIPMGETTGYFFFFFGLGLFFLSDANIAATSALAS